MLLYLLLVYAFCSKAYLLINHFAVFEEQNTGKVHNPILNGYLRVLIAIQFADVHFPFIIGSQYVYGLAQHQAGRAPCSPKIHYGKLIRLQYV